MFSIIYNVCLIDIYIYFFCFW